MKFKSFFLLFHLQDSSFLNWYQLEFPKWSGLPLDHYLIIHQITIFVGSLNAIASRLNILVGNWSVGGVSFQKPDENELASERLGEISALLRSCILFAFSSLLLLFLLHIYFVLTSDGGEGSRLRQFCLKQSLLSISGCSHDYLGHDNAAYRTPLLFRAICLAIPLPSHISHFLYRPTTTTIDSLCTSPAPGCNC